MGKPTSLLVSYDEFIVVKKLTRGSETSQYPQEKKSIRDSLSSGERKGNSLNLIHLFE